MRITNNMLVNNMMNNIGNNLSRMDKYQQQLATGKKIVVPSDDPVVAARALKLRTDVSEVQQYKRNSTDAQSWMDITESAIGNVNDVLQRSRELAVEGSSSSLTPDDSKKIEQEISQLKNQLVNLGNSTYAGRYIFSGYKTDTKLLNDDGTFAINVNNTESIKFEIGLGDDININVPGGELFNNGASAMGNTNGVTTGDADVASLTISAPNNGLDLNVDGDVFSISITPDTYSDMNALAAEIQTQIGANKQAATSNVTVSAVGNRLKFQSGSQGNSSLVMINSGTSTAAANLGLTTTTQTNGTTATKGQLMQDFDDYISALDKGDYKGVGDMIGRLDIDISNMLRVRSDVGARQNRLDLTSNRLDNDNTNFTKLMSDNEDVDMAETIMNLTNEENVYRASLAGGAKVIQPSLVDFLR